MPAEEDSYEKQTLLGKNIPSATPTKGSMSQAPSLEVLIGACAAHGLDRAGTRDELHRRLGDCLVAKMLEPSQAAAPPAADPAPATDPPSPSRKRPATAWQAFLKDETPRVREAGFRGRRAIVQEAARRWALVKARNTGSAPPLLAHVAPSEDLAAALYELSPEEMAEALEAHGLPVATDHGANAAALARALA